MRRGNGDPAWAVLDKAISVLEPLGLVSADRGNLTVELKPEFWRRLADFIPYWMARSDPREVLNTDDEMLFAELATAFTLHVAAARGVEEYSRDELEAVIAFYMAIYREIPRAQRVVKTVKEIARLAVHG